MPFQKIWSPCKAIKRLSNFSFKQSNTSIFRWGSAFPAWTSSRKLFFVAQFQVRRIRSAFWCIEFHSQCHQKSTDQWCQLGTLHIKQWLCEWSGFTIAKCGFSLPHIRKFCLLTYPSRYYLAGRNELRRKTISSFGQCRLLQTVLAWN